MDKIKFVVFVCITISFLSCQKNEGSALPPGQAPYSVVTTGILYNSTNKEYEAYYWTNNERVPLPSGGVPQAFAYGLDKCGNDMYIAGSYAGKHPETGSDILLPCYWANGVKKDLPVEKLSFSERCGTSDIKWFNGAWYVLGDYDLKPVIWKITGDVVEIIELPALTISVEELRKTSNCEVYNNRLYIGGNRKKVKNNQLVFDAGYWTITNTGQIDYHILEDNLPYALSFFIQPAAQGVYMSGEYSLEQGNSKPAVWSPSGRIPYIDQLHPSYNRVRNIAMNEKNELFAVIHNIQAYQPLLNKIYQDGAHDVITPAVPAGARGLSETLAILDNHIAYTHIYELAGKNYAEIIVNNQKQELDIDNNAWANFHRTRIFKAP